MVSVSLLLSKIQNKNFIYLYICFVSICTCLCVSVSACLCMCLYICLCACLYVYVCVYVYVSVWVCVSMYVSVYILVCVFMYMSFYMSVYVSVCMPVFICLRVCLRLCITCLRYGSSGMPSPWFSRLALYWPDTGFCLDRRTSGFSVSSGALAQFIVLASQALRGWPVSPPPEIAETIVKLLLKFAVWNTSHFCLKSELLTCNFLQMLLRLFEVDLSFRESFICRFHEETCPNQDSVFHCVLLSVCMRENGEYKGWLDDGLLGTFLNHLPPCWIVAVAVVVVCTAPHWTWSKPFWLADQWAFRLHLSPHFPNPGIKGTYTSVPAFFIWF